MEKSFANIRGIVPLPITIVLCPSSEVRGIYLLKWPSKTLANLAYFWNMKMYVHNLFFFLFFSSCVTYFNFFPLLLNVLVEFFEEFHYIISKSINLLFLKSGIPCIRGQMWFIQNRHICISSNFSMNISFIFKHFLHGWLISHPSVKLIS